VLKGAWHLMKVVVDRLNGTLSITLAGGPAARRVEVGRDVTAELDRFGRLQKLDILNPLSPGIRRNILPRLAAQFHVPSLAHLDPTTLLGQAARNN